MTRSLPRVEDSATAGTTPVDDDRDEPCAHGLEQADAEVLRIRGGIPFLGRRNDFRAEVLLSTERRLATLLASHGSGRELEGLLASFLFCRRSGSSRKVSRRLTKSLLGAVVLHGFQKVSERFLEGFWKLVWKEKTTIAISSKPMDKPAV